MLESQPCAVPATEHQQGGCPVGSGWYVVMHLKLNQVGVLAEVDVKDALPCVEQLYHRGAGEPVEAWPCGALRISKLEPPAQSEGGGMSAEAEATEAEAAES